MRITMGLGIELRSSGGMIQVSEDAIGKSRWRSIREERLEL